MNCSIYDIYQIFYKKFLNFQKTCRKIITPTSSSDKTGKRNRNQSQFISDRIMITFKRGNVMHSLLGHHLILLVLFNVLLLQCGYVNARPNATSASSIHGVENKAEVRSVI